MKYLDEQIKASATTQQVVMGGVFQYRVYRKVDSVSTFTLIFAGSLYRGGGYGFTVDITDIVRNDIWLPTQSYLYGTNSNSTSNVKLVNSYRVDFYTDSSNYVSSSEIQVAKVYRYPHKLSMMYQNLFFDYSGVTNNVSFPLQGRYNKGGYGYYKLTPRYPYIYTNNYRMLLASESSMNINNSTAHFTGSLTGSKIIPFVSPSSCYVTTLNGLFSSSQPVNFTSEFTNTEDYQGDFEFTTHSINLEIQETTALDGFCFKFARVNGGNIIEHNYTDWHDANTSATTEFIIDDATVNANQHDRLMIIFSENPRTDTDIEMYDIAVINFSGLTNDYIGKNVKITLYVEEVSHGTYSMIKPKLYLVPTEDSLLEVAGDYVAQIDLCPSRYYLQWQDRMGNFQSQPFNKHYTYSETTNRETITDYTGTKRVSNVEVIPEFKINTDWIREDLYPYYESIYTSPVLFLYDTYEDALYSLVLKDTEYTEKTFDNQKKMFNLTLNLEINQTQTLIY